MGFSGKFEIQLEKLSRTPQTALLYGPSASPGVAGSLGPVLLAAGTVVPVDGGAGFNKGCCFLLVDPVTAVITGVYSNGDSVTSCAFTRTDA